MTDPASDAMQLRLQTRSRTLHLYMQRLLLFHEAQHYRWHSHVNRLDVQRGGTQKCPGHHHLQTDRPDRL